MLDYTQRDYNSFGERLLAPRLWSHLIWNTARRWLLRPVRTILLQGMILVQWLLSVRVIWPATSTPSSLSMMMVPRDLVAIVHENEVSSRNRKMANS